MSVRIILLIRPFMLIDSLTLPRLIPDISAPFTISMVRKLIIEYLKNASQLGVI
jgi:hypothetical protein